MPLCDPSSSDLLNANPSANRTRVAFPLHTTSILEEKLLRLLAEFPEAGFRRDRHTVPRLSSGYFLPRKLFASSSIATDTANAAPIITMSTVTGCRMAILTDAEHEWTQGVYPTKNVHHIVIWRG